MPPAIESPQKPETITFTSQPGRQSDFLSSNADIVIYGGAKGGGKTYGLLIECLRHTRNSTFAAVIFRRTYPQINQEGGLWDTSERVYPFAGAKGSRGNCAWYFPSGATVSFRHMENEMDRYSWQGSQIPLLCYDQLESFTEKQFFFMFGVNRSVCGVRPYIRATCNPEPGWLADFLQWWWDPETGYAINERGGVVRYFVRVNDAIRWGDTAQELRDKFPNCQPKSLTFIPAFVEDNQILMLSDPGYMSNLLALPLVERERYLHGNWKIKATAGTIFNRAWFAGQIVKELPSEIEQWVRFWDLAATVPNKSNPDPDWTCGALLGRWRRQTYIKDMRRFRKTPKETQDEIQLAAQLDGIEVAVRMEREGGSSGPSLIDHYARNVLPGYNFMGVKPLTAKIIRWGPMSSALQARNLFLLEAPWNRDFIDELDACRGEDEKNDQADAASGAFNELALTGGNAQVIDHRPDVERVETMRYDRRNRGIIGI